MQPDFMYAAVASGEVDVIAGYTSDGRIAQYGLVVPTDPKQAIPPYDAIMLISPKRANDTAMLEALRPFAGAINIGLMREANLRASAPDASATGAARWLGAEIKQGRKK
jgi:osmoprotectant transport system permease protein